MPSWSRQYGFHQPATVPNEQRPNARLGRGVQTPTPPPRRNPGPALAGVPAWAPQGFQYSWFSSTTGRGPGKAGVGGASGAPRGEKLFRRLRRADGGRDRPTHNGEIHPMQVVRRSWLVPPANKPFAEATGRRTARLGWPPTPAASPSSAGCRRFVGGRITLRSAVSKEPPLTQPASNPSYRDPGPSTNGVAVVPARARKPARQRPRPRFGVRWLSAGYSPPCAPSVLLAWHDSTAPSRVAGSDSISEPFSANCRAPQSAFDSLDHPALAAAARKQPYVYAEWKKAPGALDYHVELDGPLLLVPYQLVRSSWRCA